MEESTVKETGDRKKDHITLAFDADMANRGTDDRFDYEPMLSAHPSGEADISIDFLGKKLSAPIWVSSMTGGTEMAYAINQRLAESCARFGLGMGLGSCRPLLDNLNRLRDFDIRPVIGSSLPLFANLGIAQIEHLFATQKADKIAEIVERLQADGMIVHVNPLQEWLQPEGDIIQRPPIETLQQMMESFSFPIIVKEVGQGMGRASIEAILKLPVAAFELAAHGGTNFSKLELLRSNNEERETYSPITRIGHTVEEMITTINTLVDEKSSEIQCRHIIVSGGIKDFLDGYYWTKKLKLSSVYGQASVFLKYAKESQEVLDDFISKQIRGLQLANTYLNVR